MSGGNECPACRRDVGIWAIIKVRWPNRIYCPHCGERAWYRGANGLIAVFAVLLVALVLSAVGAVVAVGIDNAPAALAAGLAVLVVGYVPFELAYALCLRSGGYWLTSDRHPTDEWDEEPF